MNEIIVEEIFNNEDFNEKDLENLIKNHKLHKRKANNFYGTEYLLNLDSIDQELTTEEK